VPPSLLVSPPYPRACKLREKKEAAGGEEKMSVVRVSQLYLYSPYGLGLQCLDGILSAYMHKHAHMGGRGWGRVER
jgi:hypothetical protein